MQITILQTILYTQLLTRAGFQVHAITGVRQFRGSGTGVLGAFERDGVKSTQVIVKETKTQVFIDEQPHEVRVHSDGTFDLIVEH